MKKKNYKNYLGWAIFSAVHSRTGVDVSTETGEFSYRGWRKCEPPFSDLRQLTTKGSKLWNPISPLASAAVTVTVVVLLAPKKGLL